MKRSILKNIGALGLAAIFCFACSPNDSVKNQASESPKDNNAAANDKTAEAVSSSSSASSSPCANRFYPVANGLKRNYNNTLGGKSTLTMEYKDGDAGFTEVTSLKDVTVKHE